MEKPEGQIGLGKHLANRLFPMALAIGVLISVGLPATYYALESNALGRAATIYAQSLSEKLSGLALEDPALWKYQTYKWNEILMNLGPGKDVTIIRIVDEAGRVITGFSYGSGEAKTWRNRYAPQGSAPILFNNRQVGTVQIRMSQGALLGVTLALLLLSTAVGVGLAVLVYSFPVKVIWGMEGRIQDLLAEREARAEEAEARNHQLEAVRAVTEEITRELDLATLLGLINRRAAELVGAVSGTVYLWDDAAQLLFPRAWYGMGKWMEGVRLKLGEGVTGAVAQRREGTIVNNYRTSPYASPLFLERSGITAVIAEPLLYRDRFLGVIAINNEGTGRPFTEQDQELLALFANQAAVAIANARLFEELAVTNRSLEAKNQELEAFVYTVTHDLRAPLVALQGMASMLAEAKGVQLDAEGRHYLDRLVANTAYMEELIRNLLEFSRVGRLVKPPEAVAVAEVVDGLLLQWGDLTRERGVKVVCRDLPVLWGERTRIEQIYQNLIGNALKFLGAENPAPMIELGAEDRGEEWECYISDNGIGIDPAYHGKVFELFQRLREVEAEGTGIGLAIVKKIVELAGGRIWIESEAGKGATFRFTWPKSVREEREKP